jgi:hypothetical protein
MELNSHVTIVTGIPPFVEQLCRINKLEAIAKRIKEDVGNVVEVLKEAVSNATDKKVKTDSGINSSIIDERINKLQDLLMKHLDEVVLNQKLQLLAIRLTFNRGRLHFTSGVSFGVSRSCLHFLPMLLL